MSYEAGTDCSPGWPAGGAWIDMGTNDRHELVRLAAIAAEHGTTTLEAPVTGGVHRAAESGITVLVGGDEDAFAAHLASSTRSAVPSSTSAPSAVHPR